MSKTPLTVQLMHANKRIAELESELATQHDIHQAHLDDYMELNAELSILRHSVTKSIAPQSLATETIAPNTKVRRYYDRDGQLWEQRTTYQGQHARTVRRPL
jgi:hypothetical protein